MNFILTAVLIYFTFQPTADWVASTVTHHLTDQTIGVTKSADVAALLKVWPVIFFFACYGLASAILAPLRGLADSYRRARRAARWRSNRPTAAAAAPSPAARK